MKRMSCEVCGCTDIVKDGDFFVCQACGCKYKADDVKNLIVDISGSSVNVSNTEEVSESISNKISNDKSYKGIIACSVINIVLAIAFILVNETLNIWFFLVSLILIAESVFNIIKPQKSHIAFALLNLLLSFSYIYFYYYRHNGKEITNSFSNWFFGCNDAFKVMIIGLLFVNSIAYLIIMAIKYGKKR